MTTVGTASGKTDTGQVCNVRDVMDYCGGNTVTGAVKLGRSSTRWATTVRRGLLGVFPRRDQRCEGILGGVDQRFACIGGVK